LEHEADVMGAKAAAQVI